MWAALLDTVAEWPDVDGQMCADGCGREGASPQMRMLWGMTENKNTSAAEKVVLEVGDTAPAFSLTDDSGNTVSLADFAGKKVIVYFYPRANTPGCTTEACNFRDSLTELNEAGIAVVGISPDKQPALAKFREDHELTFPLLSDPDKEVLTAYGAFGEKKNYGKVVQGVIRSTFVVDEEGKVALAKYNVKATGHVARIAKELAVEVPEL